MHRRSFILAALTTTLVGCTPQASEAQAPRFQPTRFSVQVRGTGLDVILIPGLTAGRDVWSGTVAAVPGYRYHLVQVAGFAGDPARGNAQGQVVAPLAQEIGRYIAANRLARPAIIGHSMGGTVAMMVAARQPSLVGRVMVVDMLPQPAGLFGSNATRLGPLANSLRDLANTAGGQRLFENMVRNFGPPNSARSDSGVVGRAMHELATTDLTPELRRITAPLTVVYAPQDAAAPRFYASSYANARGARFVRVPDSGHMIMLDQPTRFHTAVREFLRR
jgi:pimeloyl-ACP methyl ester carboxylesterase